MMSQAFDRARSVSLERQHPMAMTMPLEKRGGLLAVDIPLSICQMGVPIFRYKSAVFSRPQLHTSASDEDCSVDPGVVNSFTHCAAMGAVHEKEHHSKLAVNGRSANREAG